MPRNVPEDVTPATLKAVADELKRFAARLEHTAEGMVTADYDKLTVPISGQRELGMRAMDNYSAAAEAALMAKRNSHNVYGIPIPKKPIRKKPFNSK